MLQPKTKTKIIIKKTIPVDGNKIPHDGSSDTTMLVRLDNFYTHEFHNLKVESVFFFPVIQQHALAGLAFTVPQDSNSNILLHFFFFYFLVQPLTLIHKYIYVFFKTKLLVFSPLGTSYKPGMQVVCEKSDLLLFIS